MRKTKPKTEAQRSAAYLKRQQSLGRRQVKFYLTEHEALELKKRLAELRENKR